MAPANRIDAAPVASQPAVPGSSRSNGVDVDAWEHGRAAARAGDHVAALDSFTRDARRRRAEGSHGRAAIAFRLAADAARSIGDAALGRRLLAEAGRAYVDAAETGPMPPAARHRALVAAAACYLSVDVLDEAADCIEAARSETRTATAVATAS